jgi:hypothetical protein
MKEQLAPTPTNLPLDISPSYKGEGNKLLMPILPVQRDLSYAIALPTRERGSGLDIQYAMKRLH